MNKDDIKQLLRFYGLDTEYFMIDGYILALEQLVNIQAHQIERLQQRLYKLEPKQSFLTQPIRQG